MSLDTLAFTISAAVVAIAIVITICTLMRLSKNDAGDNGQSTTNHRVHRPNGQMTHMDTARMPIASSGTVTIAALHPPVDGDFRLACMVFSNAGRAAGRSHRFESFETGDVGTPFLNKNHAHRDIASTEFVHGDLPLQVISATFVQAAVFQPAGLLWLIQFDVL